MRCSPVPWVKAFPPVFLLLRTADIERTRQQALHITRKARNRILHTRQSMMDAILDDESEYHFEEDDSSVDLEAGELSTMRRSSSGVSRSSVHDQLLRSDSGRRSTDSGLGQGSRTSQKIYIITEDLTIVVAGFQTSTFGYALYTTLCALTLGIGYLLLRWLPRWQVRLVGRPCHLQDCSWVVIEVGGLPYLTNSIRYLCLLKSGCYLRCSRIRLIELESMGRVRCAGYQLQRIWPILVQRFWCAGQETCAFI